MKRAGPGRDMTSVPYVVLSVSRGGCAESMGENEQGARYNTEEGIS